MVMLVSFVVVIGALLRFHHLGGESLWLDEAGSWTDTKDGLVDVIKRSAQDNTPPLYNLFLFATIKLFGDSEWSLRLPSAIFGVSNIVVLYWLSTMTVGRTAGLVGAILLALSPFHLWYSQEARAYSLLALAATLYAANCFYYLRAPSVLRGAWVFLSGLTLAYSHIYGILTWIAIAVAFAVFVLPATSPPSRTMLVWAASNVLVAVAFAPWAQILARQAQEVTTKGFWIPMPTTDLVRHVLSAVVGGKLLGGMTLIGTVFGLVGRLRRDVILLGVWIAAPVAIGILASILWVPILLDRYVIGSLPPLLLLSAFGWTKYAKGWQGAILLTAVVTTAGLALLFHDPCHFAECREGDLERPNLSSEGWAAGLEYKEDWRGVASLLKERERPTDCVLVVPDRVGVPLNYYSRNLSCELGALKVADLPTEIHASVLFGVFSLRHLEATIKSLGFDEMATFVNELRLQGWREVDRTNFRGRIQVITFTRR
jgi:4-amino-4-deoxy-L-arabinose transferase-like glycosyltransferase